MLQQQLNALNIYDVSELKEKLQLWIQERQSIELNLEQVESIDTSGIQLLLALKTSLEQQDCQLCLNKISGCVQEAIQLTGLSQQFNQPVIQ